MNIRTAQLRRKVPEITAIFWVTKLLTTAMGEATSDFLVKAVSPYIAVALGFGALALSLGLQFRSRRYVPWIYWLAVAMVAVFGTMAADVLHKQFGVAYWLSTLFFAVTLTIVFTAWYRIERTLSIHTITNNRREVFYWLTVMATFALGTAAGDWTATSLGLGYLTSGLVFTGVMLIPVIGKLQKWNEVCIFWFAYIITRPIGASFADWFGKPAPKGRGLGDGTVSLILTLLIVLCIGYMTFDHKELKTETG